MSVIVVFLLVAIVAAVLWYGLRLKRVPLGERWDVGAPYAAKDTDQEFWPSPMRGVPNGSSEFNRDPDHAAIANVVAAQTSAEFDAAK